MKKLSELEKKVNKLEEDYESLKARKGEALEQVKALREELETVKSDIGKNLVNGVSVSALEDKRDKLRSEFERSTALISGIETELPAKEAEIRGAREELDNRFDFLARRWLEKEKAVYEEAAIKARESIQRLLACFGLLRAIEKKSTYVDAIGDAWAYLGHAKIPCIEGFNLTSFAQSPDSGLFPSKSTSDAVFNEITGGEADEGK